MTLVQLGMLFLVNALVFILYIVQSNQIPWGTPIHCVRSS